MINALDVAALVLTLTATAAAAQDAPAGGDGEKIDVEHDATMDFAAYHTYGWAPTTEKPANMASHIRIMRAVERGLEAEGLKADASGRPDVYVRYSSSTEKKLRARGQTTEPVYGPSDQRTVVNVRRVEELTLSLELVDGRTRRRAWRAVIREALARPDQSEEQVNELVRRMLARYPPAAASESENPK